MSPSKHAATVLTLAMLLSGCANFRNLESDLERLADERTQIYLNVIAPGFEEFPVVVVNLVDESGADLLSYTARQVPGTIEIWFSNQANWLFGFSDLNRDFKFQADEPWGWLSTSDMGSGSDDSNLWLTRANAKPPPSALLDNPIGHLEFLTDVHIGTVIGLDDARFSQEVSAASLWQPYSMITQKFAGLYFQEEFDPGRIPVLFIHGINGTPREFIPLIEALDERLYQAWFMYYPSGFRLETMASSVFQFLEVLQLRNDFQSIHIVAHSMGGLIGREAINLCLEANGCDYLKSFTSIASPLAGMTSADYGIEHAPTVVPVWNALSPSSEFISDLFRMSFPPSIPYNLVFAFRNDNLIKLDSSDGVVPLSSQLRKQAQQQASFMYGIDETHTGVLKNEALVNGLNDMLAGKGPGAVR